MGQVISYIERKVKAKGLKKSSLNEEKVKEYIFSDDFVNLSLLENIKVSLNKEIPILFYPGCGVDILFPLFYVEKLFPLLKEIDFIFVDVENTCGMIKTVLDDLGISFKGNKNELKFYWKDLLVNLKFVQENIFSFRFPTFDIYFEKAFRIMKDDCPGYEMKVLESLNSEGVLISDSGFQNVKLKKKEVSQKLSSYGEMVIGVKD